MTVDSFTIRYPEFETVGNLTLAAVLAEAASRVDPTVYLLKTDAAVATLAAHLLWTGVAGTSLRLAADGPPGPDAQQSRYWGEFVRIRRECSIGFLVVY